MLFRAGERSEIVVAEDVDVEGFLSFQEGVLRFGFWVHVRNKSLRPEWQPEEASYERTVHPSRIALRFKSRRDAMWCMQTLSDWASKHQGIEAKQVPVAFGANQRRNSRFSSSALRSTPRKTLEERKSSGYFNKNNPSLS